MGKRGLIALLNLSSWCLVMVERLFLVVPQGCLQFVIVVFPDHTHLLILDCFDFEMSLKSNVLSQDSDVVYIGHWPRAIYFVDRQTDRLTDRQTNK